MTKQLIRVQFTRNPYGKGWDFRIHFGCCAGYRAYDFPWHTQSIHDPWWTGRRWVSYIPGYTFRLIRNAKVYHKDGNHLGSTRRAWWVQFTSNGNARLAVPGWW